jgi:3-hydroxyisobutyrate dehydrogenase-like beta-hydroxyacid dehydrogenase
MTVGLLHPGAMGAAVGALVRDDVVWASAGRSPETAARAEAAGLGDARTVAELAARADAILSICPPHAALDVAQEVAGLGFDGLYVDANAVSPQTVERIRGAVEDAGGRFVDGGIVGGPPTEPGTRLYLSGAHADEVAALFAGTVLEPRVLSDRTGDASALKMVYAAWSKGSAAMLLAIAEVARATGVEAALLAEWRESIPELEERLARAERSAAAKGWRWIGEMEEIADTFDTAGQPDGFHRAAAEVYRRGSA